MSQSSSSTGGTLPQGGDADIVEVEVQEIDGSLTTDQPDVASFVAKALSKLEPDIRAQAEDPKRKAKSRDPGWKYGFWPDPGYPAKKDQIQCIFCSKKPHGGIIRFKQHLAGGFSVVEKCGKAPAIVRKEMHDYLAKNSRNADVTVDLEGGQDGEGECPESAAAAPARGQGRVAPSAKGAKSAAGKKTQASMSSYVVSGQSAKQSNTNTKSVASMLSKTPEEVVDERHSGYKTSQTTMEQCMKTKEQKQIVDDHVADFLFENGISLNVVNSRSWEIMIESIGQYGRGYRSPSYHEFRNPLLDRAVEKTNDLRKKHEEAWKEYGCTVMSDGWTDTSHRHLINFLANSPAGTFFLGSVDASSSVANAPMLAKLLEEQIENVGKENVVQVITDNGANFKAAGRLLMEKNPTLFWTPCAAHCIDLMLEDIGKIKEFNKCITQAKMVTRFIYKHGKIHDAMRAKIGGDLVRPAVTRFATSFLTLASMYKHKQGLKNLFVSEEWQGNKLCTTPEGIRVESIVLSKDFWTNVENCMRASQPLLIALRIADGDERPALAEISAAMDAAKCSIKHSLEKKPALLKQVLEWFDKRLENQMEQQLYGAALFLNPNRFFAIKEHNKREAARLRAMFNAVMWKMVEDDDQQSKISQQADDYERSEGIFSQPNVIREREKKSPLLWWGAYGGLAFELQALAKRIVSLCCSASGCERNWSIFSHIHTKKRNRLEHRRLNKLVFVCYNRRMANRFKRIRELSAKGKAYNPLILDEFQWDNEWVDINSDPVHQGVPAADNLTWDHVDEAIGASQSLRGRNFPRAARGDGSSRKVAAAGASGDDSNRPKTAHMTYSRKRPRLGEAIIEEDEISEDEELVEGVHEPTFLQQRHEADEDEEMDDEESGERTEDGATFQLDAALDG